jgi:carboxypeptidase PM20D1
MKKILAAIALVLVVLTVIVLVRALTIESKQIAAPPVTDLSVDVAAAAERLAQAIRFPTVSHDDKQRVETQAFLDLHGHLQASFPKAHAVLTREIVGGLSLLYTWPGTRADLAPILLMSHLDVVPVEPGTEGLWTHGAFSGDIADGYVWGRGAMDDKVGVLAILEAVELLASRGFAPQRTVYLAFGHDEEVNGLAGAKNIAALLEQRGVRPDFILDEGGILVEGLVPGIPGLVAMVSTAEKGYLSVELKTKSPGGHSSMPPARTAIGRLGEAIVKLEKNPMPARIDGVIEGSFSYLAPEMPFGSRLFLANLWLFEPLVEAQFSRDPAGSARMRSTTAATIISAGVKENVLPSEARAIVNFRILPGDSIDKVLDHVRKTVGPGIEVRQGGRAATQPSPESSTDAPAFRMLQTTLAEVFPGIVVSPNLLSGGTDTKHFQHLTKNVYRFLPYRAKEGDFDRFHGTNERVGVENYGEMVRFYAQLLRNAAGPT